MPQTLPIIMYHYVRDSAETRFPAINALDTVLFREQLDYFDSKYTIVSIPEVIAALNGEQSLPGNALLLTFDDGYLDHYAVVFPLLAERKMSAAFFVVMHAVQNRRILDVNKIHFVLASAPDSNALAAFIDGRIAQARAAGAAVEAPEFYRERFRVVSQNDPGRRFDRPDVLYLKRLLQNLLPEPFRGQIVAELFRRYVTQDEAQFADELYVTIEQLREMQSGGMYVGPHGATHRWLNRLDKAEQKAEIDDSIDIFQMIGASDANFAFCYPFGAYSDDTLALLRARGCAVAFTSRSAIAQIGRDPSLELPRLDCNDVPARLS